MNSDYSVSTDSIAFMGFSAELIVDAEIFLRADRIGLENNETFTLNLEPADNAAMRLVDSDIVFVNLMTEITIVDADGKPIECSTECK